MKSVSFLQKLSVCFLAGAAGAYANFELCRLVFSNHMHVVNIVSALLFWGSISFSLLWQYLERRDKIDSPAVLGFWRDTLCYFIAIDLCMFAMRKIFHLQFYAPDGLLDKQVSALSGEQLVIVFFAHSYLFGLCIASLQIVGSLCLLFRRTRLLGVFILLPVVFNIILLDIFYDVDIGALFQCCALTVGLLYLLLCHYESLLRLLFNNVYEGTRGNQLIKYIVRISVVLIPVVLCTLIYDFPNRHPKITGKYEVRALSINGQVKDLTNCSDSLLTLVYIDDHNDIVFERNSMHRWRVGHFSYDKNTGGLKAIWRYPKTFHDTLSSVLIQTPVDSQFHFSGTMGEDTFVAELKKVK